MRSAILLALTLAACSAQAGKPALQPPPPGFHTVEIAGLPTDLMVPENPAGSLLVLPGWNFPKDSWRKNSRIEKLAKERHLILVMPEMLKTLYETAYYPETTLKWNAKPGSQFLHDDFLPAMQKQYSLFLPGQKNYVIGLSTGGRGVAMTILENPGLFSAGAAFSGDFAQERMPGEAINAMIWGPFQSFPDRWRGRDNPAARISEWKTPLYLAHGLSDSTVPPDQTQYFSDLLRARQPDLVEVHLRSGFGHDYRFWDSELPGALDFLLRH